jgi:hypothetical protein
VKNSEDNGCCTVEGDISQEAILPESDTVVALGATEVVTAKVKLAIAGFDPDTINVSVSPKVETPGTIKVNPNTT